MNRQLVWIKINTRSYYNLLFKLNNIGITIYDSKNNDKELFLKVKYEDYIIIKEKLFNYEVSIYKYIGVYKLKVTIKKNVAFLVSVLLGILILFIANNMIFKVEIKTTNRNITNMLVKEFNENGLGVMKLKKRHNEVEKIVKKILEKNKEYIEWLEVKFDGLIMVVNVVEKTKENLVDNNDYCDIVAKTDSKILSMNVYRGTIEKEINDYVKKGDVILSGKIMQNEELKNTVCANGIIYGEVWYKITTHLPLKETYKEYTGNKKYNFNIKTNNNKYKILRSRIKIHEDEEINLYKLNDFEINLVKEKEYTLKERNLTEKEAYNKALKLSIEKAKLKLRKNEEIIYQKVLKKSVFDSTIYLEVFIVTKEEIGTLKTY